jgi:predicted nucleic acid-binding protein
MNIVVDASCVVKMFIEESDSVIAQRLLDAAGLLIAPSHMLAEVGHVLARRHQQGHISRQQLDIALLALPKSFATVAIDDIFERAVMIALGVAISVYDSLYVAAAERWSCDLVTSDLKLVRACAREEAALKCSVVALSSWEANEPPIRDRS